MRRDLKLGGYKDPALELGEFGEGPRVSKDLGGQEDLDLLADPLQLLLLEIVRY